MTDHDPHDGRPEDHGGPGGPAGPAGPAGPGVPAPHERSTPRRRIVTDAWCHRCGYNVRGIEVDEADVCVCPECAMPCTAYYLADRAPGPRIGAAQWSLAAMIAALGAFVAGYQFLSARGLNQTAALFVGLPAVVALLITLAPRARSAAGMALKGVTIALLVSGMFLGEGMVCVLMMAPIFYAIALFIGLLVDFARRSGRSRVSNIRLRCWIALPLLLLSLEGVAPWLSLPRRATVTRRAIVEAPPEAVAAALAATPRLDRPLPAYLGLGFPRPMHARGRGLAVDDERVISFQALEGGFGDLHLRVVERGPGRVVFAAVSDTSKIARWLGWERIEVTWDAAGAGRTVVCWAITYERRLDPAWYFAPWQRYAVGLAAGHLIETVATPRAGGP